MLWILATFAIPLWPGNGVLPAASWVRALENRNGKTEKRGAQDSGPFFTGLILPLGGMARSPSFRNSQFHVLALPLKREKEGTRHWLLNPNNSFNFSEPYNGRIITSVPFLKTALLMKIKNKTEINARGIIMSVVFIERSKNFPSQTALWIDPALMPDLSDIYHLPWFRHWKFTFKCKSN